MLHTRTSLENAISSLLGGTLAEELLLGEASDGCTSDLQRATQIARRMVAEFGMSRVVGRLNYARDSSPAGSAGSDQAWSEQTAREIDLEVRRIIEKAETRARRSSRDQPGDPGADHRQVDRPGNDRRRRAAGNPPGSDHSEHGTQRADRAIVTSAMKMLT